MKAQSRAGFMGCLVSGCGHAIRACVMMLGLNFSGFSPLAKNVVIERCWG